MKSYVEWENLSVYCVPWGEKQLIFYISVSGRREWSQMKIRHWAIYSNLSYGVLLKKKKKTQKSEEEEDNEEEEQEEKEKKAWKQCILRSL